MRTLSVEPALIIVCRTIKALKTTCNEVSRMSRLVNVRRHDIPRHWVPGCEIPRPCKRRERLRHQTKLRQ